MSPQGGRAVFFSNLLADQIRSWLEVLREDDGTIVRAASGASKAPDYLLALGPGAASSEGDGGIAE